jgi:hypothetical protein
VTKDSERHRLDRMIANATRIAPPQPGLFDEELLCAKLAAQTLRVHESTLERWRATGGGPRFIKMGPGKRAPVRYRRRDVEEFLDAHSYLSTSQYVTPPKSR